MTYQKRRYRRFLLDNVDVSGRMLFASEVKLVNISIGGVSLKADRRLNIGNEYTLKLEEGNKTVSVKGNVVWSFLSETVQSPNGDMRPVYKAGLKFTHASSESIARFLRFFEGDTLEREEAFRPDDRRFTIRFHLKTQGKAILQFPDDYRVKKISLGGMLIMCDQALEAESRVPMELSLHDGEPIRFVGRVAVCNPMPDGEPKRYHIGIEFLDLSDRETETIMAFIEHCAVTGAAEAT